VSGVTDMSYMFQYSSFNQPIGAWNVSKVTNMMNMFFNDKLSVYNYDTLLIDWSGLNLHHGVDFNAGTSQYDSFAAPARAALISTFGWLITDGGLVTAVPTVPLGLTATAGNAYMNLTWFAPTDDGGLPVTHYKIFSGTSLGHEVLVATTWTGTIYKASGLVNGLTYYFSVAAANSNGTSANATTSGIPATVPGLPTGFAATAGNDHVMLSWTAPSANGGSVITNYRIYDGTSSGDEVLVATAGNVTVYDAAGLANGMTYNFTVAAVNAMGAGANVTATCIPATAPNAPLALHANGSGNGWAVLTWTAPASDGGAAIAGYLVFQGTSAGGETLIANITSPATTSCNCTGLENGVVHYFSVLAYNGQGSGNNASTLVILASVTPNATGTWMLPVAIGGYAIAAAVVAVGAGFTMRRKRLDRGKNAAARGSGLETEPEQ
jgi:hypothetical protein